MSQSPNRFERRKQRTRKKLQRAALSLIVEKGYEAVTIQEITDRADLGRATFYIHYADKEALLWEALSDVWAYFPKKLAELQQQYPDKPAFFLGLLFDFTVADENRDLYRIIVSGAGPVGVVERAKANIAADIRERIENGQFATQGDLPVEVLTTFAVGAIGEMISWWLGASNEYSAEDMAEMAYRMFAGLVQ